MLLKVLEAAAGSGAVSEEVTRGLAERSELQRELQRCLREMQQKDRRFQQVHSKVTWEPKQPCGPGLIAAQK